VPILDRLNALFGDETPAKPAPEAPTKPAPEAPAKPAPEAPAEAPAKPAPEGESDEPTPPGLVGKAAVQWGVLRKEVKSSKSEAAAAKRELEELRASMTKPEIAAAEAELVQLRERVTDYERELQGTRLEATLEYRQQVAVPLTAIRDTVADLAEVYETDLDSLQAAVSEGDRKARVKKLAALAEGMLEPDRMRLYKAAEEFDAVIHKKELLEADAGATLKKFEIDRVNEARRAEVERNKKRAAADEQTWSLLQSKSEVFREPTVAKQIREIAASAGITGDDPDEVAYSAFAGAALPALVRANNAAATQIADLTAQIEMLRGASPNGDGNGNGGGSPPLPDTKAPRKGFLESVDARLGSH
jgi:hypothetical protein